MKNSILIVDDNPNNIRILFDILHEAGFKVYVVKSGEMALEKLPVIQPDMILLDIMMPGIDGFETCKRIKADSRIKEIPVIFLTALSDTENKVKGLLGGAVDYISKPIQVEEVLARVNIHLALRNTELMLKKEVNERTEAQNRLEQTLTELQQAQTQIIQSEKMSSLGQLVAGVAHEINNPVNFISANLTHANEYAQELLRVINVYQHHYPNPLPEVEAEIETSELNYLIEDFPKLLQSMKVGAKRIQEIVLSLRVFSRLDEADIKPIDIHQGIDSTLMILGHRLKANSERLAIEVIKKYNELPLIECYAGQLNQVFMNLLSNAIDAIEEKITKSVLPNPEISISTELVESNIVKICIADNGLGIPEQVKQKIFNPFFTTKPIGVGTGMGLAISYQIITERHAGSLHCVSELGQGSEFIIQIPLRVGSYIE
ncbi:hypothetical protein DSM106972_068280 [Dulcicalothrix desertica PCC 7102]|uniref:histidine kinase n=1 Tax=Dulcicalothrix desertica PCC 7102 TaxID=232991 RepID=A0A3S1CGW0_9CYAN|nr:response regulator [Dulcicalothrix desertica]RUT01277.1 hypothetical protein DSM106972_068280 [Dulcicalothrix desertica PCC 7102]TWH40573.1 phospho-acceptor domain-containing protein [Dulcicalothrix desertica PCC 7102]